MAGALGPTKTRKILGIPPITPQSRTADKPDLSVDGKKITGPKTEFGLSRLGESTSQTDAEAVSFTGVIPARRKKPTITLLGDQP